jgi:hypothetical protein
VVEGKALDQAGVRLTAGRLAWALSLLFPFPGLAQAPEPSYHALQLDCARYRQEVRSTIRLEGGRQRSRETTGRDGTLTLRATARDTLIALVAWFDTLSVWREGEGERIEPETDGVIGGRFRGTLTRLGGVTVEERPFVPDDIAQVADVGDALEELLPPLPPAPLAPGAAWRDDSGTVLSRIPDGISGGRPVQRYRLIRRSSRMESRLLPDSTEVRASRKESESGVYEWSEELGPVRWEREITVDVEVPSGGPVRQPFRSRIEQQVTIQRVSGGCGQQQ